MKTIVFLHIPKTAGQTVHSELTRIVGAKNVSPVRVHTQAKEQFPKGYRLYSGHLDWLDLETLPDDRFTFSVLRDPRERIASFYLYLLKQAKDLTADELALPGNLGKAKILNNSADDYFFAGNPNWQRFIKDHYDNFYCSYFATKRMRGWRFAAEKSADKLVEAAAFNAAQLDRIYSIKSLSQLEADIHHLTGSKISVAKKYVNVGPKSSHRQRWPELLERFEKDSSVRMIDKFVHRDTELMDRLDLI